MHQLKWLTHFAFDVGTPWPFTKQLMRQWVYINVHDDIDALGCVLMGGEL